MKLYQKTFVNPLHALCFKDGVNFVDDPDYKALDPKREGPNKWVVIVEYDDDDDTITDEQIERARQAAFQQPVVPEKKQATLRDYEDRLNKMTPAIAKSMGDVIHPPVKISAYETPEPCGECIPCCNGQDCIRLINEACDEATWPTSRTF